MREEDWSPTTAAGMAARLVALKASVPSGEWDGLLSIFSPPSCSSPTASATEGVSEVKVIARGAGGAAGARRGLGSAPLSLSC
eukprot:3218505-Prymnesium_polylepis.2